MATSLISTGVQFPDNSIQTTAATGGGDYILASYVSPATWTKPAGLRAVKVTVVGAGGAGGPMTTGPTANAIAAGGGGGGAAILYIDAPAIPGPVAVTAGPGTNSFGAFCSATAGGTGGGGAGVSPAVGGTGGAGSGGTLNITGAAGMPIGQPAATPFLGGNGGSSILGGGGRGAANAAGGAGGNYGGGGGGASKSSPGSFASGAGAPGVVIVEEFY